MLVDREERFIPLRLYYITFLPHRKTQKLKNATAPKG